MKRYAQSMMLAAALVIAGNVGQAQSVDSMPPVVVKTLPESGDKAVAAGTVKIQVTFSKERQHGGSSMRMKRPVDWWSSRGSCRDPHLPGSAAGSLGAEARG
jgi:hypothetical protein